MTGIERLQRIAKARRNYTRGLITWSEYQIAINDILTGYKGIRIF